MSKLARILYIFSKSMNLEKMNKLLYIFILLIISTLGFSQPVPNVDENIPYLMTFGNRAETSWGDDDFSQTFFF